MGWLIRPPKTSSIAGGVDAQIVGVSRGGRWPRPPSAIVCALVFVMSGVFSDLAFGAEDDQGCRKCHSGIEAIGTGHEELACDDCHGGNPEGTSRQAAHAGLLRNPKALGLGTGHYVSQYNGVDIPFELERIVDEDGNQIQATSHVGARPFNREELARIQRVNVCSGCHRDPSGRFWKTVAEKWGTVKNNKAHHEILETALRSASE